MAKKENILSAAGITQYLDPEYWFDWLDDEVQALASGDAMAIGQVIVDKLTADGIAVTDAHFIVHDQDIRTIYDDKTRQEVAELKPKHVHGVLQFDSGSATRPVLSAIAAAVGVDIQYVEKPKRGRYAIQNMLSYLIHAKNADKHQYSVDEVATVVGQPYSEIYALHHVAWRRGRAVVAKKRASGEEKDELLERVATGKISLNEVKLSDELYALYWPNKREFELAEQAYIERAALRAMMKLERGEFSTTIVFVTGKPGAGKTYWVRNCLLPRLKRSFTDDGRPLRSYFAASANAMDEYVGEEIIVLDDLRANSMDASSWLTLLDPYAPVTMPARYRNKSGVAPRMIILSAYLDPREFFSYVPKGGSSENLNQFIRRLDLLMEIREYDGMTDGIVDSAVIDHRDSYTYHHVGPSGAVVAKPMSYGEVVRYNGMSGDDSALLVASVMAGRSPDMAAADDVIAHDPDADIMSGRAEDVSQLSLFAAPAQLTIIPPQRYPASSNTAMP